MTDRGTVRARSLTLIPALLFVLLFSLTASGQQPTAGNATSRFDPRDFSGFWLRDGPRPWDHPPLTRQGMAAMRGRLPDYLATVSSDSNDPMYRCNPQGFPRLVWEEEEPIEFVHTDDRILQLFQWEGTLRELWLDGRELPSGENLENLGPAWYGHSVAEWQGDTLVVTTTGVDERAWLDEYANPKSFDARFEERYRRIDVDTIEGQLTIHDPANYTAPWTHAPSVFERMRPEHVSFFGWKSLFSGATDMICAPLNESDFNERVRDPSILGVPEK